MPNKKETPTNAALVEVGSIGSPDRVAFVKHLATTVQLTDKADSRRLLPLESSLYIY
ncbi:hypothetical protein D9M71_326770 [compost metagenome]